MPALTSFGVTLPTISWPKIAKDCQRLPTIANDWQQFVTISNKWQQLATLGNNWRQLATICNNWRQFATNPLYFILQIPAHLGISVFFAGKCQNFRPFRLCAARKTRILPQLPSFPTSLSSTPVDF